MDLMSKTLEEYFQLIASDSKEGAGGSTLAVSAAMGSQLIIMYCDISYQKWADSSAVQSNSKDELLDKLELLEQARGKAKILGEDFRCFIEKDVEVVNNYFSSKNEDAAKELTLIPFLTAQRSKELLKLVLELQYQGYGPLEPDLMAASYQGRNALFGSLVNTDKNLALIADSYFKKMLNIEASRVDEAGRELINKIDSVYFGSDGNV